MFMKMFENNPILAYCGLNCKDCEAYKATQEKDVETLAKIAERWSEQDNASYVPEDMICEGCDGDKLNKYCQDCEVRGCGMENRFKTCAECDEYPCKKLYKEWKSWVESDWTIAKSNLDKIREK